MKVLIIYAHPKTGGHCSHALDTAKKTLDEKKIEYEVLDLYAMNYDPILHENEHYSRGHREVLKETLKLQEKIKESRLLFIYPVWWSSMPAILKGFIDRVFVAEWAFRYKENKPIGLLTNKAATILTMGASKLMYSIMLGIPGLVMKKGILGFCGITSKNFKIHKATNFTDSQKVIVESETKKAINYLLR